MGLELSDGFKSPPALNESTELTTCCLTFTRRTLKCYKAVQDDGVELGFDHERGEQHRRSQRAHHALLLQTGGRSAAAIPTFHTTLKHNRSDSSARSVTACVPSSWVTSERTEK